MAQKGTLFGKPREEVVKHPGSFSAAAKRAGKSTAVYAREKKHAGGLLGKRARLACGGGLEGVNAVMAGRIGRVFSTHRPPGHHAERDRAMGFCLFNHVAVAADYLLHAYGPDTGATIMQRMMSAATQGSKVRVTASSSIDRVAIVDFDFHHGNGTQHSFEDRADVLFISIQQDPRTLYPGTGFATETGRGKGSGHTLNVPMPPGSRDSDYERAFEEKIL